MAPQEYSLPCSCLRHQVSVADRDPFPQQRLISQTCKWVALGGQLHQCVLTKHHKCSSIGGLAAACGGSLGNILWEFADLALDRPSTRLTMTLILHSTGASKNHVSCKNIGKSLSSATFDLPAALLPSYQEFRAFFQLSFSERCRLSVLSCVSCRTACRSGLSLNCC